MASPLLAYPKQKLYTESVWGKGKHVFKTICATKPTNMEKRLVQSLIIRNDLEEAKSEIAKKGLSPSIAHIRLIPFSPVAPHVDAAQSLALVT
ncbi:hypothetical protein OAN307_c19840 [Octadecabacter antarcticus 307]|uniref:Uncharacterized protein n=1 Tax=Octadecabacter antarcticus 307 TaxID=391626 RepID=M9RCS6_9RHOB|nr:hypothetical protein OAN307_c19840 [Octadecabacter antarcticus 307]